MTRDKAADASALCTACGFCCDGTLFMTVRLAEAEGADVRRHGLPVVVRDDLSEAMLQPCRALSGTSCTIYTQRPQTCRRYRCLLLTALDEGETDLADALQVVSMVRASLDSIADQLPEGAARAKHLFLPRKWRRGEPPVEPPDSHVVETFKAIEEVLAFRFRGRHGHE